jgi:DNA-directed RNA polymerase specialized sigma24 family protein/LysM repeat protein
MRLDGDPLITEPPALSPDLEWMLQSSQASPAMLAEALVREYYALIYRLALSILDDERAARQAAQRAVGEALANVHLYREGMGVQNWLYCLALINIQNIFKRLRLKRRLTASLPLPKRPTDFGTSAPSSRVDAILWLTVDSLEDRTRLPLLLEIVHGWKTQDIALILDVDEVDVQTRLEAARVILSEELGREGFPVDDLEEKKLDALLRRSLGERWPSISLSTEKQSNLVAEILKNSGKWGTRGRLLSSLKDLLLIGLVLVVMGSLAWAWNRWSPKSVEVIQIQSTPTISSNEQGPESTPSARIYRRTYIVKPGDTLPSISAQTGTSVEDLKRLNYIGNEGVLEPGRVLEISFWLPTTPQASPTPVTPVAPVSAPFTEKVTSQEIYQRLVSSSSNWHTLWADLQQIDYGPEGYIGPPQAWRVQAWISQPDQIFELYGPLAGLVEYEGLNTGGLLYITHKDGDEISVTDAPSLRMLFGNDNLFFPSLASWLENGAFQVIGSGQVAGRAALVVDSIGQAGNREERLWIDIRTGVLLRLKLFGEHNDQVVVSDYRITAISFDVNFSQATFDPARAFIPRFVQNYRGEPAAGGPQSASAWFFPDSRQRLERLAPPPGFDPSHSRLTFQYLPNPPEDIYEAAGQHAVELFAGDYYLGSLQMACPWSCPCTRSPDGSQIAYVSDANSGDIHWIDLSHPEEIHGPSENLNAGEPAFAPDDRTLAIYGVGFKDGRWIPGIFTLDTLSGEYDLLIEMDYAYSLAWSPDGKYLALIGAQQDFDSEEAMIIRLDTRQVVYRTPVDSQDFQSVSDPNWPARDWGVEFPFTNQGLETCSFPSE